MVRVFVVAFFSTLSAFAFSQDMTHQSRLKWSSTVSMLKPEDVRRAASGTPLFKHLVDLRWIYEKKSDFFSIQFDPKITWTRTERRIFDLSASHSQAGNGGVSPGNSQPLDWGLGSGRNHEVRGRVDRLAMHWRRENWGATVGRHAISWGSGIVFHPLDLLNPFSPTIVDKEFKPGADLVRIETLLEGGGEVEALAVLDRNENWSSLAARWHQPIGSGDIELVVTRHYDDSVLGLVGHLPLSGTLLRTDIVRTCAETQESCRISGIVNADRSWVIAGTFVYAFIEFYRNAFGVKNFAPGELKLPQELTRRVARGEVFNLMRDYISLGVQIPVHPLIDSSFTVIRNVRDNSQMYLANISWDVGNQSSVQFGGVYSDGEIGDEFGGLEISSGNTVGAEHSVFISYLYVFSR